MNENKVSVMLTCPFCRKAHEVEVNYFDFWNWENGMLAQEAFPYLSATEREQLISELCPDCQKEFFD